MQQVHIMDTRRENCTRKKELAAYFSHYRTKKKQLPSTTLLGTTSLQLPRGIPEQEELKKIFTATFHKRYQE